MTHTYKIHKGIKMRVRENTSDSFIMEEVLGGEYRKLNILPTDIVADIGLNIGVFSIWALQKGARKIHSYEPDKENFELARHNLEINGLAERVQFNNLAVTGTDDTQRQFSVNHHKNKGLHSLLSIRGRDTVIVNCININEIISSIQPTVMKLDIEGGEYECLLSVKDFGSVQELILEFHHAQLNDMKTHEKYKEILNFLGTRFDKIDARDPRIIGGAWTGIIHCANYG